MRFCQICQSHRFFWRGDIFLKTPQLPRLPHNKLNTFPCLELPGTGSSQAAPWDSTPPPGAPAAAPSCPVHGEQPSHCLDSPFAGSLCALSWVQIRPFPTPNIIPMWRGSTPFAGPQCSAILYILSKEFARDSGTRALHCSQAYFVYIWFNQVVAFWPLSKLTSGWPLPCPLPAARPQGNSPLNLQTNIGHIGWSTQLQTWLFKRQGMLFCKLQVYFVFGHSHLWASLFFFFFLRATAPCFTAS